MEHCKKSECGLCEGGMAMVCGSGNCGGHYGLLLLRWFLGLVILLMVFTLGVKVGFYKGVIETAGYGDDAGYGWHSRMMGGYRYSRPMMYGWYGTDTAPVATPSAPAKK